MSDIVKSLDLGDYKEIRNKGKELISTLTQHQNNLRVFVQNDAPSQSANIY